MSTLLLLAQAAPAPPTSGARLVIAALVGIALLVVLITRFKVHPFLGLTIGSLVVAGIAGLPVAAAITAYLKGFGDTAAGVGTLIALGAMFGKLLADSGGGDQIADTIIGRSSAVAAPLLPDGPSRSGLPPAMGPRSDSSSNRCGAGTSTHRAA